MDVLIGVVVGAALGAGMGYALGLLRASAARREATVAAARLSVAEQRVQALEATQGAAQAAGLRLSAAEAELQLGKTAAEELRSRVLALAAAEDDARRETAALGATLARTRQELDDERSRAAEKLELLGQARAEMADRFQALANEVVTRTGDQLSRQQQERLGTVLQPLADHLGRFESQVKQAYETETRERVSLKEQITHLTELNRRMGAEADTLARALKGESKMRGDWGEVMLSRILEHSGLRPGEEYREQASFTGEDGARLQPDVIVSLSDGKSVVIDAKLPLIAWMELTAAADAEAQAQARRRLVEAVRIHLRGLSQKRYQDIPQLRTLDFVLLFIPVEAAFVEVLRLDPALYEDAQGRGVVLVSPTTLMAVLRTVAVTWRHERQERNAQRIAVEAGRMYDKLCGFVEVLQDLQKRIQQAHDASAKALSQLSQGPGNLVRRAEQLRELGARTGKRLPDDLTGAADEAPALLPAPEGTERLR